MKTDYWWKNFWNAQLGNNSLNIMPHLTGDDKLFNLASYFKKRHVIFYNNEDSFVI